MARLEVFWLKFQVDRLGRRVLLLAGSIQGFLAEIAAAILLAVTYKGGQYIPQGPSIGMLVLICIFSISFGYGKQVLRIWICTCSTSFHGLSLSLTLTKWCWTILLSRPQILTPCTLFFCVFLKLHIAWKTGRADSPIWQVSLACLISEILFSALM